MSNLTIKVYRDIMGENAEWALKTKELSSRKSLRMYNIIGSPGSGKTTLLESVSKKIAGKKKMAVLEGDVETTRDAERLHALGVPVSQLLTSGACHLEAKMVFHALNDLPLDDIDLVIVENVGNLVCPAEFDIGEKGKIAVLSVTEGEDKPIKYPLLFREACAIILTKIDLLPHLPFELDQCISYIKQVNSTVPLFQVSAIDGSGIDSFTEWLFTS